MLSSGVSVVVPVYNSEGTLEELVSQLTTVLTDYGVDSEILLVNDGSRDGSWKEVERLAGMDERVRGIDLMRNFGQHNAILAGVRNARYDVCVTLDDDLQNPPNELPRLLAKLNEGYQLVYGYPKSERHGFRRRLSSRATKMVMAKTMSVDAARHISTYRVFRTNLRDAFGGHQSPNVNIDVLLSWGAGSV